MSKTKITRKQATRELGLPGELVMFELVREEPFFSHNGCDCCRAPAGDRYEVITIYRARTADGFGSRLGFIVCPDCVVNFQ